MRLNAKQLREVEEDEELAKRVSQLKRQPIFFILENVYDTYNIGGIFRLADAIGVEKMYICGQTEIPPNHKIKKASIGTYKVVPWEYKATAKDAIDELRASFSRLEEYSNGGEKSISIYAIEQSERSIPYTDAPYTLPLAFILGNETYGILPETLDLADQIVEIPMWGINKSLNVIVSAAIVAYYAAQKVFRKNG